MKFEAYLKRVGRNIRAARVRMGLRQKDIHEKSGLTYRYYQSIEAGEVNATLETLFKLSELFEVTIDQMVSPHGITGNIKGVTVLIVDDEQDLLRVLKEEFEKKGCRVLTASEGGKAFETYQSNMVDAIVTDIRMPNGSGIELLDKVKSIDYLVPVIFMTGYSGTELEKMYQQGVDGYFMKPFQLKDLSQKVTQQVLNFDDRWREEPSSPPDFIIEKTFPDIAAAKKNGDFRLGRGGIMVETELRLKEGSRVGLRVTAQGLNIFGTGVVRWINAQDSRQKRAYGIEFEYLEEKHRKPIFRWITSHKLKPFIPKR